MCLNIWKEKQNKEKRRDDLEEKINICMLRSYVSNGLTITAEFPTNANESRPMLDGSYLTCEDESTGIAGALTRGVDLQTGYSKLRR